MDIKVCLAAGFLVLCPLAFAQQVVTAGPLPPINVLIQLVSKNSFVVSWSPPPGNFDYYLLQYSNGTDGMPVKIAINKTEEFHVEINDDIDTGGTFAIELQTVLGEVESPPADLENALLPLHDPRLPPKVVSMTKQWLPPSTMQLQWTLPTGQFEELHLLYAEYGKRPETVKLPKDLTSYQIKDLSMGKRYDIHLYTVTHGIHSDPAELIDIPHGKHACQGNPCTNNGQCSEGKTNPHLYVCECPTGYNGTRCEINIDECNPNPCLNEGVCMDGINSFTCVCDQAFTGDTCENGPENGATALIPTTILFAVTHALYKIVI